MANRYDGVQEALNQEELYKEHLERRGVKHITQYKTYYMVHPEAEDLEGITMIGHTWSLGDRYYKIAYEYYGDSRWWWLIAWFNQKPTESHVELGEVINIPTPLDKVLRIYRGVRR